MPIPIQSFGSLRPLLNGSELLPLVAPDGSGNYTDHRSPISAIAALVTPGNVVAIVPPNPRGTYDNTATYAQLDTVRYTVSSITATYLHHSQTPSTGIIPTDISKWMLLARDGADGMGGGGGGGLIPRRIISPAVPLQLTMTDNPVQWLTSGASSLIFLPEVAVTPTGFFYLINGGSGALTLSDPAETNTISLPSGDGAYCWLNAALDGWLIQIIPGTTSLLTLGSP
jgi:hypothetical protein